MIIDQVIFSLFIKFVVGLFSYRLTGPAPKKDRGGSSEPNLPKEQNTHSKIQRVSRGVCQLLRAERL